MRRVGALEALRPVEISRTAGACKTTPSSRLRRHAATVDRRGSDDADPRSVDEHDVTYIIVIPGATRELPRPMEGVTVTDLVADMAEFGTGSGLARDMRFTLMRRAKAPG